MLFINNAGNLASNLTNSAIGTSNAGTALGSLALNATNQASANAQQGIGAAASPLTALNQYMSTIFGVPNSSTNGNFTGTTGTNTSSKGMGGSVTK